MKAMIFAAGLGTRLYPLTERMPKALVPVCGEPMLGRVIRKLKNYGITDIVVNVHHYAEQIERYVAANGSFGLNITISDERGALLDTGGGVRKALPLLRGDGPVLLHNADILTDFDLGGMVSLHETTHADATLLVADRPSSRQLLFDENGRLGGWTNVNTGETRPRGIDTDRMERHAFGGVHIITPAVLDAIEAYARENEKFSITPFYVDRSRDLQIMGYLQEPGSHWFDIGKPETLAEAENFVGCKPKN